MAIIDIRVKSMAGDWGGAKLDAAYDFDIVAVAP